MSGQTVLLAGAILSTGLMAGFFFGWSVSVIPGHAGVSDHAYVSAMQHINRAIINPAFVIPFLATPALLAVAAFVEYRAGNTRRSWTLAAAAATYLIGVLGVTVGGNVPLNDALDEFDLDRANAAAIAERRESYETSWNRWHQLRTAGSIVAFGAAAASAVISTADD